MKRLDEKGCGESHLHGELLFVSNFSCLESLPPRAVNAAAVAAAAAAIAVFVVAVRACARPGVLILLLRYIVACLCVLHMLVVRA